VKTIFTDRYGLYPWLLIAACCWIFLSAYWDWAAGHAIHASLNVAAGAVFLTLAIKRLSVIGRARREGRGHTIERADGAK
jgi:hypothetical protein